MSWGPIQVVREEVLRAYYSAKWKARVRNMTDAQVLAIYARLKRAGQI